MKKILVVDENQPLYKLMEEILPDDITIVGAPAGIYAGGMVTSEQPQLVIAHINCKDVFSFLDKMNKEQMLENMRVIFMGKAEELSAKAAELQQYRPLDRLELPFTPERLEEAVDEAFITVLGLRDELTGFYKKPCFDSKIKRLLEKKEKGALFLINLDKYSYASNTVNDAQLQLRVYALQKELKGAVLGRNGDQLMGFMPGDEGKEAFIKRMDKMIETVSGAADDSKIYISVGAAFSETYNYDYDEMWGDADRALGVARSGGKNCCRFYR